MYTIKEKSDAKHLYTVGKLSALEISKRTGISTVTLSKWVNKEGWKDIKKLPPEEAQKAINGAAFNAVNAVKVLTAFTKYLEQAEQPEVAKIVNANIFWFTQYEYPM